MISVRIAKKEAKSDRILSKNDYICQMEESI